MSTSNDTVAFIEEQLAGLPIRTRPMFGEYGIYCDDKIVGLICQDRLFIKPSGIELAGTHPAPPYPGAKEYLAVPRDLLDDADWLQRAIRATADALPAPQPKKLKSR